jgi:predicted ribosome quality control (RQC) complex YloA/Tae2 family protein
VASKGRRYRTVVVEGYEVLIGKGDAENDELTFALAAPGDFWLHVAGGVPGSHIVVRNPEKLDTLPRAVLERAAELAAWHSKARAARRVDVHLCRVADVTKPRGAPPGQVELRRWERVRVCRDPGVPRAAQLSRGGRPRGA